MLTPGQIKDYKFQPVGQGVYRADEVDRFFSTVYASYEKMYKENGDLIKRAGVLADKIKEYQAEEELIKKTLLIAQKKADEIESTAKKKSEESVETALREAREKTAYAEKRVKELVVTAEERAKRTVSQAEQRATDTLRGASLTAEQTIGSAKGKATLILKEAKTRAESILAEAQRRSDEILGSLKDEVEKEKKALETVRAQSKEFKTKLTESYYEQIGMTTQLLGFVDTADGLGEKSLEEAKRYTPEPKKEPVEESVIDDVEKMMDEVQAAAEEKAPEFVIPEPVISEPVNSEPVNSEPELDFSFGESFEFEAKEESVYNEEETTELCDEPVEASPEFEATEEQTDDDDDEEDFGGFSFVGGAFADFEPEEIEPEQEDIPDVTMPDIDDIFSQELSASRQEPEMQETVKEEKPFGRLNDKYMSYSDDTKADDILTSGGTAEGADDYEFASLAQTREESPAVREVKKEDHKEEKKKKKLSLFSKYEDDDDDDDDFDDDDFDDDDDEDGGFKGLFRKK